MDETSGAAGDRWQSNNNHGRQLPQPQQREHPALGRWQRNSSAAWKGASQPGCWFVVAATSALSASSSPTASRWGLGTRLRAGRRGTTGWASDGLAQLRRDRRLARRQWRAGGPQRTVSTHPAGFSGSSGRHRRQLPNGSHSQFSDSFHASPASRLGRRTSHLGPSTASPDPRLRTLNWQPRVVLTAPSTSSSQPPSRRRYWPGPSDGSTLPRRLVIDCGVDGRRLTPTVMEARWAGRSSNCVIGEGGPAPRPPRREPPSTPMKTKGEITGQSPPGAIAAVAPGAPSRQRPCGHPRGRR